MKAYEITISKNHGTPKLEESTHIVAANSLKHAAVKAQTEAEKQGGELTSVVLTDQIII